MWRLHRYYLKELAVNAAITFIVLFGVVLISLVYRGIQRSQGGELLDAAKITLFWALDAVPHLLTIAFLIATVVTYTRAAQDRELIAVRAAGISPRVPMQSAVLVGIMLSVCASFANHYMIPAVHFMKYRVIKEVVRSAFINLNLGSDRIKLPGGRVLTFRERDPETDDMLDCTVYSPEPIAKDLTSRIVFVDRVSIPKPKDWDPSTDIEVVLSGVREPNLRADPIESGELRFAVPLDQVGSAGGRIDKDEDVASDQLLAEIMRGVHTNPVRATYTLFRRCSFSLMPALLAPIGFCIAEMASNRGRVFALMLALVPLAMFYLGEVLGARFLISTNNPWCGWMPVLLLSVVGLPLVWRQLRR
ncbi:MAG: lipopolysaccharide export LptBFGC system permease protein LptF [Planctomycetota bacterium]|jgi:lipopolysaccharide export LptBFGC system permease protein LptF